MDSRERDAGRRAERPAEPTSTASLDPYRIALHGAAVFASAFLIFLVQPMVGKRILPWFGGVPAVWAVCLAFNQTLLFLGYGYAHLLIRFLDARRQLVVHAGLIGAALISLPVLPQQPPDELDALDPSISVLSILATSVSLPFLCLSATGPLVQAWFARRFPERSPYPLYAVSNLGSLLALVAYPIGIEPNLSLTKTGSLWGCAFAATTLVTLACLAPLAKLARPMVERSEAHEEATAGSRGVLQPLLWIALSGTAVVIFMGITNKLCMDVASFPFLWMLPLATYLATFILAFSSDRAYRRPAFIVLALTAFCATRTLELHDSFLRQAATYSALLFATCMVLHGELHRSRPAPHALTFFYLCIAAGGAIGGLFVGIAAPSLFDDYHELPIGLGLAALLTVVVCASEWLDRLDIRRVGWRWLTALALLATLVGVGFWLGTDSEPRPLLRERSFFGVLTVSAITQGANRQLSLTNGTTMHGRQFEHPAGRRIPTAYYGVATGLGLAVASVEPTIPVRIGVIGLGVGTVAAYGRENDLVRFYEIDPVVVRIARDSGYFSYLADSRASIEIVVGDARRSLLEEQRTNEPQDFDILVLDAFTSDAIPVHLLTREAFESDLAALAEDGFLAVHLSSRSFDLVGVVARLASELGANSLQIQTRTVPERYSLGSEWVLVTRSPEAMSRLADRVEGRRSELEVPPDAVQMRRWSAREAREHPLWTDDYSDVLGVLHARPL